MNDLLHRRRLLFLSGGVVLLLVFKYFWPFFVYPGVPFGYDAGIYRFLFVREATGWPPFLAPSLPEWAKSHAPGLFFLSSPLIWAGVSPDILIGWMWNLFPIVLAATLSWIFLRSHGSLTAFFVLVCALVSVVQLHGFLMMYSKVMVAFLFCILAFTAWERRPWASLLFGMFTIALHQQIGLIYVVSTLSSLVSAIVRTRVLEWKKILNFVLTCMVGFAWYIPTYQRSFADLIPELRASSSLTILLFAFAAVLLFGACLAVLPSHHRRRTWMIGTVTAALIAILLPAVTDAPESLVRVLFSAKSSVPGAFIGITEYLRTSAPLLLLGLAGLILSTEDERGSPWQWAAVWCGVAAFGMFFFYRRFLLPLDFFLLPFAAIALTALWRYRTGKIVAVCALLLQGVSTVIVLRAADPHIRPEWLREFSTLSSTIPEGASVIVLDNMAPWVLGYLPDAHVSGPGIFDSRPYAEWEKFLLGSDADRTAFLSSYPAGTYFYASPVFAAYYPSEISEAVLKHPCLEPTDRSGLYRLVCGEGHA